MEPVILGEPTFCCSEICRLAFSPHLFAFPAISLLIWMHNLCEMCCVYSSTCNVVTELYLRSLREIVITFDVLETVARADGCGGLFNAVLAILNFSPPPTLLTVSVRRTTVAVLGSDAPFAICSAICCFSPPARTTNTPAERLVFLLDITIPQQVLSLYVGSSHPVVRARRHIRSRAVAIAAGLSLNVIFA